MQRRLPIISILLESLVILRLSDRWSEAGADYPSAQIQWRFPAWLKIPASTSRTNEEPAHT